MRLTLWPVERCWWRQSDRRGPTAERALSHTARCGHERPTGTRRRGRRVLRTSELRPLVAAERVERAAHCIQRNVPNITYSYNNVINLLRKTLCKSGAVSFESSASEREARSACQ